MIQVKGYAAQNSKSGLVPYRFERQEPQEYEVLIEMLDYCAEHNLNADVEVIPPDYINIAYERMLHSDVQYRFVIDMKKIIINK